MISWISTKVQSFQTLHRSISSDLKVSTKKIERITDRWPHLKKEQYLMSYLICFIFFGKSCFQNASKKGQHEKTYILRVACTIFFWAASKPYKVKAEIFSRTIVKLVFLFPTASNFNVKFIKLRSPKKAKTLFGKHAWTSSRFIREIGLAVSQSLHAVSTYLKDPEASCTAKTGSLRYKRSEKNNLTQIRRFTTSYNMASQLKDWLHRPVRLSRVQYGLNAKSFLYLKILKRPSPHSKFSKKTSLHRQNMYQNWTHEILCWALFSKK